MKKNVLIAILIAFPLSIALNSCVKEEKVTLNLPENLQTLLVVDGKIEAGKAPCVLLTKGVPITKNLSLDDLAALSDVFISNATVSVNDGTTDYTLTLQAVPEYPYICYTTNNLIGQVGKTYTLSIAYDAKTYSASTSIMPLPTIQSLTYSANPIIDSFYNVILRFDDPASQDNYYLSNKKTNNDKENNQEYLKDEYFNGNIYNYYYTSRARQQDTIEVSFSQIPKDAYDFLRLNERNGAGSGLFNNVAQVKGNIQGTNTWGLWYGYQKYTNTIIIP